MKNYLYKIKNHFINKKFRYITLLAATIVVCIIYKYNKIKPFGNNSMLDIDFYHQYGPYLNELKNRIEAGRSLLFSFNTGGGVPFFRNFLNYLSSPFNIILFLFKKENVVMSFSIIIGVKVIFAAFTFNVFLEKTFKNNDLSSVFFSLFYAFSGYFCAYYWNIMWLDGIVFLPLIIYGINKLINENRPYVYAISLACMLFANYFIGYMICIFSALYFIGYMIYKTKFKDLKYNYRKTIDNILSKFIKFSIFSIISAGLVAFALVPLFKSLSSISATGDSAQGFEMNFNVINYLFNHITAVNRSVFASDKLPLPNIYPGLLSLASIFFFFLNKKINLKAKIMVLLGFFVFYISFNCKFIDFIWHAFHVPNDLPYRYSFIYVFCLVMVAYYGFSRIKEINKIKIPIVYGILMLFVLIADKVHFTNINDDKAIVCIVLLLLYLIITMLYVSIKDYKKIILLVFILVGSFESIYGVCSNWNINHDIKTFMSDKPLYEEFIKLAKSRDNGLNRIEKTSTLTLNDGSWYDYNAMSTFSSMAYEGVAKFQRNIGVSGNNINSYYYQNFQTPFYNTIFNVKYILGHSIYGNYYYAIKSYDFKYLFEYQKSTSIGFAVNNKLKNYNTITNNPFLNHNMFVENATGINNIYNDLNVSQIDKVNITDLSFQNNSNGLFNYELTSDDDEFIFYIDNPAKQSLYFYIGGPNVSGYYVNDSYYSISSDEYYTLDTGILDPGNVKITIKLKNKENSYLYFYAYTLNDENFELFYKDINSEKINVKKYNDTKIEGDINVSSDKIVFTSLSYDKGFNVYVDNKKVKTFSIDNAYLAFDISKGKHKIKIEYYPDGLNIGIIISIVSYFIIYLDYLVFRIKNSKKDKLSV